MINIRRHYTRKPTAAFNKINNIDHKLNLNINYVHICVSDQTLHTKICIAEKIKMINRKCCWSKMNFRLK